MLGDYVQRQEMYAGLPRHGADNADRYTGIMQLLVAQSLVLTWYSYKSVAQTRAHVGRNQVFLDEKFQILIYLNNYVNLNKCL